jgi:ferrochelatase
MQKINKAIILMNLGSPASAQVKDVRKYLNEFLMDKRVIDTPYIWRSILVKGIITPFRAPKSAEAYRSVWGEEEAPLVAITRRQQQMLMQQIKAPVEIAMRYGNPTMEMAYNNILAGYPHVSEVVLLPLYPHFAMSSYETAVAHAEKIHKKNNYSFKITVIKPFYNDPVFIRALADSISPYLATNPHLLFSYHSIPERHIHKSDITGAHCLQAADCCNVASPAHAYCYRHQCLATTRLVVERLGIPPNQFSVSFQSKLGRSEWLKPSTTLRMEEMPKEGIRDLAVVCPAFVSDCLETLEEINIRERENFLSAGGENFTFIPCMDTQPAWISAMAHLIGN